MTRKLLIFSLLSGYLCAGQVAPTAKAPGTVCVPSATTPCTIQGSGDTPAPGTDTPPAEPISGQTEATAASARTVGPITTRSEFEIFAEDAAGAPLSVYGRQMFDQVPTTFAPLDRVPVSADYALGPGDQLLIRAWGKIDLDASVTVDRNGQIFLPRVGSLSVAGLRYEQLDGYLRSAISNLYKGFDLNVTMGQLRSIQIFVLGSARQPGEYTISSLSTLVNALFASGGPSATGSMRHIQLRRANQVLTEFDIYDLLRRGDKSHDVQLLPGDVIYIPPVGPQVAVMGSVNEPGIYELNGETTIASGLKAAGGLTNLAEADRVLVERIENHRRRRVDEFRLDAPGLQRILKDGDLLRVFPISPQFDNAVTLRGNIEQPGHFAWHEGMRIADLIPSRSFLISRDYWKRQNHLADNMGVEQNRSAGNMRAGQNQLADNTHVDMMADLVANNAEINWDYAAVERLDEKDLSTRVIAFNLGNAIDNPTSADNQALSAGDVITIFSRKDLALPVEKHAAFVRIGGEVGAPGVYRVNPGDTLRNAVERAGGLTPHSYLYASELTRVSARVAQEEQLRLSIARMQKDLVSRYAAAPSVNSANGVEQAAQLATQRAAIDGLTAIHPTGRIVLGMNPRDSTVDDIPNFPLEDGDSFYIPPKLSTVQVAGAVYNESAFRYQPHKRLSAYLNDAGGPTRQADIKRIFLIRADGTVVSRQRHGAYWRDSFESLILLPGDGIIVPTKLNSPGGFMQQLSVITQILSQTAMTGAVIGGTY
jgi:polysaccharide biosynthesis/export protein